MFEPASRELHRLTAAAVALDIAIRDYERATKDAAARAYAATGRPFAPEIDDWRAKVRSLLNDRRALVAIFR